MESTGTYWIALFDVLEERGFEALLVDARKLKKVPDARPTSWTVSGSRSCTVVGYCRDFFAPRR